MDRSLVTHDRLVGIIRKAMTLQRAICVKAVESLPDDPYGPHEDSYLTNGWSYAKARAIEAIQEEG